MKRKALLLAIMAGAAWPVLTNADQTNVVVSTPANMRANTLLGPHKFHFFTPFSKSLPAANNRIYRVGNLSSRPWAEAVGWQTGVPAWRLEDGEFNDGGLTLIWWGREPDR